MKEDLINNKFKKRCRRLTNFFWRQVKEISLGGLPALLLKVRLLLFVLPAALVVLMVRMLRPLVVIRFGALLSERIGHLAINTELYLCERDISMHGERTFDIFFHNLPISNQQLRKMLERNPNIRVWPFAKWIDWVNSRLPGCMKNTISMPPDRGMHSYNLLMRTPPHLSFTPEEERRGNEALRELGIPEGTPFVCFCTRDSAYLDAIFPQRNWRYHDYRDASIHNQVPAAEELARRDYYMIRMGAIVKEALKTANPMILDYATNGRTDFLDIYLCAKCRFFIVCDVGINSVPKIFRRPIVYVNFVSLGIPNLSGNAPGSLFIPKKLWLRKGNRFLTFREMLDLIIDTRVHGFYQSGLYEQLGMELVESTPEEITAVAVEMDERLKGMWKTTEEDEELQRRFWSILKANELHQKAGLRIGAEFLRQNRELLYVKTNDDSSYATE